MTYDEMTIDELNDAFAALLANEVQSPITLIAGALVTRCAVRDAFLDLAEALDAEGLVVVPWVATKAMLSAMDGYSDLIQPFQAPPNFNAGEWRRAEHGTSWWAACEAAPLMGVAA